MKKRSIALMLVLVMLFSITAPDRIVYAQDAALSIEEASAQKDEKEEFETEEPETGEEDKERAADPERNGTPTDLPTSLPGETFSSETGTEDSEIIKEESKEKEKGKENEKIEEPAADTEKNRQPAAVTEEKPEFDGNKPFTMAMLAEMGDVETYDIDMEKAGIPLERFRIETETDDGTPGDCKLVFPEGMTEIRVGEIQNTAPALLADKTHGNEHAYAYAHVGNTEVFYIGHLTVHDGEKTEEYTVYTTDKHIDKRTVYVVLKENETINLVYRHGEYHTIDYQFQNMDGQTIQEGRDDSAWTYDKIFGHDRVRSVASGDHFNGTVTIPRGYRATVLVKGKDGKDDLHDPIELGRMMKYFWESGKKNQIQQDSGNNNALKFKGSYNLEDVKQDVTVIVRYEKINSFTFYAKFWRQTDYAYGRFRVRTGEDVSSQEQNASDANCTVTFGGEQDNAEDRNSFTWNFNGISAGGYTYEMDQLEINGEPINVPMVSLADKEPAKETTKLSTGTVITLTVTSLGGNNGSTARRAYTLKAENCYEDLTISGGNMVSHSHKEFVTRALIGVKDATYWHGANTNTTATWNKLKQNTLLAKPKPEHWEGFDTFRMKLADGYKNLNVTFTDKESNVLQTNDDPLENGTKNNYIEYLIREYRGTDSIETEQNTAYGTYRIVPYEQWEASPDGYYYCRATNKLREFMNADSKNGVVMLWFYADASMYGIDYQDGAVGDSAPVNSDIENLPVYQDGGEDGYNLFDNTKALVSNYIPLDTSGKFVFDHWVILKADENGPTNEVKTDKDGKPYILEAGGGLPLSKEALEELKDCLYYNKEQQRNTLTLRAVWRNASGKPPIPYTVNYYITEIKDGISVKDPLLIEGHQHMANEGATLVADLWQDANKTLSPIITEILKGDNDQKEDYTKGGTVQYIIYEERTDKKLENVSKDNNVVNIYLVKQPNLTINKTVTGKHGDLTKSFKFTIELSMDGVSQNGTYQYTGKTIDGVSGATAPADGTLTFTDGKAEIGLAHGQQITFTNLPFGCTYTVTETQEEGYKTSYSIGGNNADEVKGILETDVSVSVVNEKADIPDTGMNDSARDFGMLPGIGATALLLLLMLSGIRYYRKKA